MVKFFLRFFSLLLFTVALLTIYLSYVGINTEKFNNLINKVNGKSKIEKSEI